MKFTTLLLALTGTLTTALPQATTVAEPLDLAQYMAERAAKLSVQFEQANAGKMSPEDIAFFQTSLDQAAANATASLDRIAQDWMTTIASSMTKTKRDDDDGEGDSEEDLDEWQYSTNHHLVKGCNYVKMLHHCCGLC